MLHRVKVQFTIARPPTQTKNEASTVNDAVFLMCPAYAQDHKWGFHQLACRVQPWEECLLPIAQQLQL